MIALAILVILLFIGIAIVLYLKYLSFKKEYDSKLKQAEQLQQEKTISEQLEAEKKQMQEKNKKLFAMSEAVYKEKKKVDEENEMLKIEKEKLAAEKKKVDEKVKKLWNQSTAIHKEKEKINLLKIEIEHKHQEVMDSVNYAKRIQEAILPPLEEINQAIPNSFVLFKPKDIVSGDFYWFSNQGDDIFIAACDCTGHGVPGAFMSMIGNTLLNQIVNEKKINDPAIILQTLNEEINFALKQTQENSDSRDGMDVALCKVNFQKNTLHYAGANRPLYLIRNNKLEEIKANKFAIGGFYIDVIKSFTTHQFELQEGDCFYLSTDGYADQFSPDDKKLMTKKFKEILLSIHPLPMQAQREYLANFIENWMGSVEQTDDVLVIGARL